MRARAHTHAHKQSASTRTIGLSLSKPTAALTKARNLRHKARDYAVELAALEVQWLALRAHALFACTPPREEARGPGIRSATQAHTRTQTLHAGLQAGPRRNSSRARTRAHARTDDGPPVHNARKLAAVLGTMSRNSSISILPALNIPILMSRNTCPARTAGVVRTTGGGLRARVRRSQRRVPRRQIQQAVTPRGCFSTWRARGSGTSPGRPDVLCVTSDARPPSHWIRGRHGPLSPGHGPTRPSLT